MRQTTIIFIMMLTLLTPVTSIAQNKTVVEVSATTAQKVIELPMDAVPDETFAYQLPFRTKKAAWVMQRSPIQARHYNEDNLVGFICWEFVFKKRQDIYAIREGQVRIINDMYVEIVHKDGSAARYSLLDKNSIKVTVGQTVTPDMKIGQSGKDEQEKHAVEIEVYHITANNSHTTRTQAHYWRRYIKPYFATSKGVRQLESGKSYKYKQETTIK